MSKNAYVQINYEKEEIKIEQLDNSIDVFKKPLPVSRYNKFPRPSSLNKKNGFSGNNIKREANNLNHFESKSGGKMTKLEKIPNNINCIYYNQNDKQNLSNYSTTSLQTKYLELPANNFFELGDFSTIPDFEKHLYNVDKHFNLNDQHFRACPLISKQFTQKKYLANNNIYSNRKRFLNKKSKYKSCKSYSTKNNLKRKRNFMSIANFKLDNCGIEELFISFNIPEKFLTNFDIKGIIKDDIENNINKEKKPPSICLKDTEIFLNNLCKNVIISKEEESNTSLNGEYMEYKILPVKVGELFSIEKKPKKNLDYDECNSINHNLSDNGRRKSKKNNYPLKKNNKINNKKLTAKIKNEIKLNNQKNGEKKFGYLNQFKINNNSLVNFPFFPSLNIERIIYVKDILKSIIENGIIGFNEKVKLIKDERNAKYMMNKRFEIIYQNKEGNAQYILHLNEFHILYLIFFYYYQIKEELLSVNQKYTGHRSKEEISNAKNKIEMLINKCNIIVKNIMI